MDFQWVGSSCGQHGPYTFYKAFRFSHEGKPRILSLGEFFFLRYEPEAPLCLGELQLLWEDHNNQQLLSSSRLYFLPEDTPQGRDEEHGQDEVVAVSQKLILRVQDLASWTCSGRNWPHGLVVLPEDTGKVPSTGSLAERIQRFSLNGTLNISDVQKERQEIGAQSDDEPSMIVLSYPRYCRFRAIKRRLAAVANPWLRSKLSAALGGFSVVRKTHIMYCQDSFHHHDLYDHPHICDELAPNLKGRPRKKHRLKLKHKDGEKHVLGGEGRGLKGKGHWDGKLLLKAEGNSRTRKQVDREEEAAMLTKLFKFMKDRGTPISRIPSLGFKQIDLYLFFSLAQKIGGYEKITEKRMWKHIYDKLGGNPGSTSAATCTRRHYEKLLMPFERHLRGEKDIPPPPIKHRARKQKDAEDKAVRAKIKDLIKKNEEKQPDKAGSISVLASTTENSQPRSKANVATSNAVSVSGAHGKESLVKLSIPSLKPNVNPSPLSTHMGKPMQAGSASGSPHVVAIEIQRPGVAPPPLTSATRKAQPLPANKDIIRGRSTAPLQPSQAIAPLQKSIRPPANVSVNNSEKAASAYVSSREHVPVSTTSKTVPTLSDSELVLELTTKKGSQGSLLEGKVVTTPNSRLQGERRLNVPMKPLYPPPPLIKDGNHRPAAHAEVKPEPATHIPVKSSPAVTNPAPSSIVKVFVPERRQANAPEVKVNPTRSTRSPPVSRSEPVNNRPSVIQHTQKVKPTSAIHPDDLILRQMSQQRDHDQKLMRPSNSMTGHKRTLPPTEQLERHYMSQLLAAQAMAGQLELEAYYPLTKRPRVDSPSFGKENADAKYYSHKFQTFFPDEKGAQSECLQPSRSSRSTADDSDQPTDLSLPKSKVSGEESSSKPAANDNRPADRSGSNLRDLSALQEGLPANLSHKLKSETGRSGGEDKAGLSKVTVSIPGSKHDDKRPAHTKAVVSVPPSVILTTSPSKTTSSVSRSHTESTSSHPQIVIPDYNPNLPRRMDVRDGLPHVMITDYNPNLPKAPLLMPEYSPHLHSPPYAHPHLLMHSPQGQVQLTSHPAGVYAGHFHSAMYEEMLRQHLIGTHAYPMQLPHPSMFPHLPEGSFPPHMYHSN